MVKNFVKTAQPGAVRIAKCAAYRHCRNFFSTSAYSAWSAVNSEKINVAFPPERGNMENVRRSRACSLTFCGPRGRDSPEPATGNRRRDVGGAGRIAPARFGAIMPYSLRLPHPASATGGAFHVFWVASPNLNPNGRATANGKQFTDRKW